MEQYYTNVGKIVVIKRHIHLAANSWVYIGTHYIMLQLIPTKIIYFILNKK